jgi:hypothetical protein
MRTRLVIAVLFAAFSAPLAAQGLQPPHAEDVWPQWQARVTLSMATWSPVRLTPDPSYGRPSLQSGALYGDYYFDVPGLRLSSTGGLRATGGLVVGTRGLAPTGASLLRPNGAVGLSMQSALPTNGDPGADTVPYLGLGYTGLAAKGGWGFTADLGLVAENPGGAGRVGRALFGNQSLDGAMRDMRFTPVIQVGVSYAF